MASDIDVQAEPESPQVAKQRGEFLGKTNSANARAMRALRAELRENTRMGRDERLHGPLQPATIINFNPVSLHVGGLITQRIPAHDFPGGKTKWQFERGGRMHTGHFVTFRDAIYYMSTTGHEENVNLGFASMTMTPRYMSPTETVWHFWRQYSTEAGDAQKMGGILIFDGDMRELSDQTLRKSGGEVYVPESYPIPDTRMTGYRLRTAKLSDEIERIVEMQVQYVDHMVQRANEYFQSKDVDMQRNITAPMRKWGLFGVAMGYLKEKQPWMNENPTAGARADAIRMCPTCRTTTTDPDAFMCGPCKAPYDADCLVTCVERGYPVAESYIDALDPRAPQHRRIMTLLREQSARRAERIALLQGHEHGQKQDNSAPDNKGGKQ